MTTLTVNVSLASAPPVPGDYTQMSFSDPAAPTRAEVERLIRERWHTRPDWWINGTTPKVIGTDTLPAQFSYDAGANRITVASNGGTLTGWDFAQTHTTILISSGDDIAEISHCKFAYEPIAKADRISSGTPNAPIQFARNDTGRLRRLSRCWFTVHDDHDYGPFGPLAQILTNVEGTVSQIPTLDLFEYSSVEGASNDSTKNGCHMVARGVIFDAPTNMPPDAEQWDSGTTYNRNDVIWGPDNANFPKLSLVDNNNDSPNFGSVGASTASWEALDPHTDLDQAPNSGDQEFVGCFFNRDTSKSRPPIRQLGRGLVSAIRRNQFTGSAGFGSHNVHHCIFTDDIALGFTVQKPLAWGGPFRTGAELRVENNFSDGDLWQSQPAGVTESNNSTTWTWWSPATLSSISASYSGGALTYGFTASLGGWATVVLTASSTPMTAKAIIDAFREGTALAAYEIDAESDTAVSKAHTVALSAGTYYAHMLYQAGGGIDTIAAVQTVSV